MGRLPLIRLIDWAWHRLRGYEHVPAEEINNETGTMDFYCSCRLCKRKRDRLT